MAFNVSKFLSGAKNVVDKVSDVRNAATTIYDKVNNLKTIVTTAQGSEAVWAGRTAAGFAALQRQIQSDLGHLLSCHYFIELAPYGANATGTLPIVSNPNLVLLATEANLPAIQAEYDTAQVGAFTINQLKGISDQELQINFVETKNADIMSSLRSWSELMVNDDGTMREPSRYAARLKIGVFDRKSGLATKPYDAEFLVAPLMGSIESLSGESTSEVVKVSVSFQVLRRFML